MQILRDPLWPSFSVDEIIESVSRSMSRRSYRERLDYMRAHEIPRFLYKFRPAPTDARSIRPIRDIIVNSALWLGSPEGFNDPFDAKAKLIVDSTSEERRKRFNEIFKREGMPFHERERQVPRLVAKPIRELEKVASTKFQENMYETGVVSFAGNPLSILMWSHYGSDHRGVCFQFDVAKDPERFFLPYQSNTATIIRLSIGLLISVTSLKKRSFKNILAGATKAKEE